MSDIKCKKCSVSQTLHNSVLTRYWKREDYELENVSEALALLCVGHQYSLEKMCEDVNMILRNQINLESRTLCVQPKRRVLLSSINIHEGKVHSGQSDSDETEHSGPDSQNIPLLSINSVSEQSEPNSHSDTSSNVETILRILKHIHKFCPQHKPKKVPGEQVIKKGQKHLRSKRTTPTYDPDSFTQIHHQSSHTHHLSSKYINKTPNNSSLVTYSPNHITSSHCHLKTSPHHIKYSPNHLNSFPPNLSSSAFRQNSLSRQLNTSQFHVDFAPLDDKVSPIRPNITYNKAFQFSENIVDIDDNRINNSFQKRPKRGQIINTDVGINDLEKQDLETKIFNPELKILDIKSETSFSSPTRKYSQTKAMLLKSSEKNRNLVNLLLKKKLTKSQTLNRLGTECCENLRNFCLDFIDKNFRSVSKTQLFTTLDKEIIKTILGRNTLQVRSEIEVFKGLTYWSQNKEETVLDQDLMYLVRYLTLTPAEFKQTILGTRLLSTKDQEAILYCLEYPDSVLPENLQLRKT